MRREDRRCRALERVQLKERIGVHDDRRLELGQQPGDDLLRPRPAPEPGAERDGACLPRELDDRLDRPRRDLALVLRARELHRLEQPLLEDRQRRVGHGDRHVARVRAEGRLGGERRCPGQAPRAADDQHRAGRVLVLVGPLARDLLEDRCGHEPVLRLAWLEPDVGDDDLAGVEAARSDLEADLPAVHRHRERRVDAGAGNLARRRVDPGGQVDRDDRSPRGVDRLDLPRRVLARLAVEAGPEERVHDYIGARQVVGDDRVSPGGAQDVHGDPPVAAVRTAAADRDEPPRLRESPHRLLGNRAAGAGHQLLDVVARLGRAHLVRGVERLKHPRRRTRQ